MITVDLVTNGLECLAAFPEESFQDGRNEDILLQQRQKTGMN